MRTEIKDLRLLKLAAFYEQAHERFLLEVARRVTQDPAIRAGLERLAQLGEAQRKEIQTLMEERARTLRPEDHQDLVIAALLDVRDMERDARDFCYRMMDGAHDEAVFRFFRKMLREEEAHVHVIDELVYHAERTRSDAHGRDVDPYAEGLQLLHDLEVLLDRKALAPNRPLSP